MKKSFILSLVMVVVLIASLATATYAWYTAQTAVQATETSVATAVTDKSIVINNAFITDVTFSGKTVDLAMTGTPMQPMILAAEPTVGTTGENLSFVTFTLDDGKVGSTPSAGTPATISTVNSVSGNKIFIANTGSSASAYKVNVVINDTATNKGLRVAVFYKQNVTSTTEYSAGDLKLLGIWAPAYHADKIYYQSTTIAKGDTVASGIITAKETAVSSGNYASGEDANLPSNLAAWGSTNDVFTVVAWFEGGNITNAYANQSALFTVNFTLGAAA